MVRGQARKQGFRLTEAIRAPAWTVGRTVPHASFGHAWLRAGDGGGWISGLEDE
jgi:hypothetical protein